MKFYVLQFQLDTLRCLSVGDGRVAASRYCLLLLAGAQVGVIVLVIDTALRELINISGDQLIEPAYAGIPLTYRDRAHTVWITT